MISAMIFMTGCINSVVNQIEVTVTGTVERGDPTATSRGTLYLTALREWRGEGDLRYPMLPIESTNIDGLGRYEWTFLVDTDRDEGLAIYGWLDEDDDGVLCRLDGATESAGLTVLDWNGIDYDLNADLTLDQDCVGAERLYSIQMNAADETD